MSRVHTPQIIEVGGDKYSIEFTYPATLFEGVSKENILLIPKHFLCDSVIKRASDGTFLICRRLIDAEIKEVTYENSSGDAPEGGTEISYSDSETRERIGAKDNAG